MTLLIVGPLTRSVALPEAESPDLISEAPCGAPLT